MARRNLWINTIFGPAPGWPVGSSPGWRYSGRRLDGPSGLGALDAVESAETAAVSAAVAAESAETAALRAQRPDAVSMARRDRGDAVA